MKCEIAADGVKVFARAIHCLAKFGNDLYIEPLPDALSIRSVNQAHSVYGCVDFYPSFFTSYSCASQAQTDSELEACKCKISMKTMLSVFRSIPVLERNVQSCCLELADDAVHLIVTVNCKYGVTTRHKLPSIESESVKVVYSKNDCTVRVKASAQSISHIMSNIPEKSAEVTFAATPDQFSFSNYVEHDPDPGKVVHSELAVQSKEFDEYKITRSARVTCFLKEIKAILHFSDSGNLSVGICFEKAGRPLIFTVECRPDFEANFVMATLAGNEDSQDDASTVVLSENRQLSGPVACATTEDVQEEREDNAAALTEAEDLEMQAEWDPGETDPAPVSKRQRTGNPEELCSHDNRRSMSTQESGDQELVNVTGGVPIIMEQMQIIAGGSLSSSSAKPSENGEDMSDDDTQIPPPAMESIEKSAGTQPAENGEQELPQDEPNDDVTPHVIQSQSSSVGNADYEDMNGDRSFEHFFQNISKEEEIEPPEPGAVVEDSSLDGFESSENGIDFSESELLMNHKVV